MRSRGLVVAVAIVLAVAAGAAVVLYTNSVKADAVNGVEILVSTKAIPANTFLGATPSGFKRIKVPSDALVRDAVTSIDQLKGRTTSQAILANEQIPLSRISGNQGVPGGNIGIEPGHVAVSIKVEAANGVAGTVSAGSYVAVFGMFKDLEILPGSTPQEILARAIQPLTATSARPDPISLSMTLVPAAKVLKADNPPEGSQPGEGFVTLTLDVTPRDAQNIVYAQGVGQLTFALLPPGTTTGTPLPFSTIPKDRLLGTLAP